MQLIFLYGMPATGKLTVAQHLARLTGFRLFHNHLAVDLLLSTFEFGPPPFVALREQIWLSVFDQASRAHLPGLIFTFAPEPTVRPTFIPALLQQGSRNKDQVHFIQLTCPMDELRRRLDTPSRREFGKLTSLSLFNTLHQSGVFDSTHMPQPALTLDTSQAPPEATALAIAQHLNIGSIIGHTTA